MAEKQTELTLEEFEKLVEEVKCIDKCNKAKLCPRCTIATIILKSRVVMEISVTNMLTPDPAILMLNLASMFLMGQKFERARMETERLEELYTRDA